MIQAHGGFARIHSHGRLKDVLDHIAAMEPDALDPIEPPPQGDVELGDVRERYGQATRAVREHRDRRRREPAPGRFEEKVKRALDEGTAGDGRGFVLMPSAAPYGRTISRTTMCNYETMVRLVGA